MKGFKDSTRTQYSKGGPAGGATADKQGNYAFIPRAVRLQQTAGNGSARLTIIQAGITG